MASATESLFNVPARLPDMDTNTALTKRQPDSYVYTPTTPPRCLLDSTCHLTPTSHVSLSRTTLILALTLLATLAFTSTTILLILLHRRRARRKQSQAAKSWGRKSRYLNRISIVRKQVDDDLRRQFHGVYVGVVENPEMGSDSPVEMGWEERVWEVPNVEVQGGKGLPALPEGVRVREGLGPGMGSGIGGGAGGGRKSLFFCDGVGVWLPKR